MYRLSQLLRASDLPTRDEWTEMQRQEY